MMLKQAILLDHSDLKVDQPLGFCPSDISKPQRILFDHQLTMINRLMEQERDPTIFTTMNNNPIEITTNRLLLNDYVSAGKTTEIIALQSMNPKTLDAIERTNIANIDLEKTVQTYNKNNKYNSLSR